MQNPAKKSARNPENSKETMKDKRPSMRHKNKHKHTNEYNLGRIQMNANF